MKIPNDLILMEKNSIPWAMIPKSVSKYSLCDFILFPESPPTF